MLDLVGEVLEGKYKINKQLGQGGMGAVYSATHLGTDRPVALKVIIPQHTGNLEFVERFKREAKATGRLIHPNIVNVTDFGFTTVSNEEIAYLVMEYLDGHTLGELLENNNKLPLSFITDIVEQTSLAIDAAHKQGIIHRDLKPENIWLQPNGRGSYNVKVLDFGLAKIQGNGNSLPDTVKKAVLAVSQANMQFINNQKLSNTQDIELRIEKEISELSEQVISTTTQSNIDKHTLAQSKITTTKELTRIGTILGTPMYMSPEQCKGEPLDGRSDIYSLGVIVYRMLVGEPPFKGIPLFLMAQHAEVNPPPIREKSKDIPKPIADLIMSSLSKKTEERPISAMAFATALRTNVEGAKTIFEQAKEIFRKHRSIWIKIALLAYTPGLIVNLFLLWFSLITREDQTSYWTYQIIHKGFWVGWFISNLFVYAFLLGQCALVMKQLQISQKNTLNNLGILFSSFQKNFWSIVKTNLYSLFICAAHFVKLFYPGAKKYIEHSLAPISVFIENKRTKAALERSKKLVELFPGIIIYFQIRNLLIVIFPMICFPLMYSILVDFALSFEEVKFFTSRENLVLYYFRNNLTEIIMGVSIVFQVVLGLWFHPKTAIALVITYFKTLEVIGESENKQIISTVRSYVKPRPRFLRYIGTSLISGLLILVPVGMLIDSGMFLGFLARHGYVYTLKTLLNTGFDVNSRTDQESRHTLLMVAALYDQEDVLRLLTKRKASINLKDNSGSTALTLASRRSYQYSVSILLENGANPNEPGYEGRTALHEACFWYEGYKSRQIIENLLASGANPNARDNQFGSTPLMQASGMFHCDEPAVVDLLIKSGADINATDNYGYTPLLYAARRNNYFTMKYLLDKGANISATTKEGETVLMVLVANIRNSLLSFNERPHIILDIVKLLASHGVDINAKDKKGKGVLDYTQEEFYLRVGKEKIKEYYDGKDLIDMLKEAGAKE